MGVHPGLGQGTAGQLRSAKVPFLRRIVSIDQTPHATVDQLEAILARADEVPDEMLDAATAEVHPGDPGIIIYTSGTRAHPKAALHKNSTPVVQTWRGAKALGLTPRDHLMSRFQYFWSGGYTMTLGGQRTEERRRGRGGGRTCGTRGV